MVGGECTTCASTASSLNHRRANARRPLTHSHCCPVLQQVGGNVALALLLTVSSNMLGIFTLPFMLSLVLGTSANGVQLSPWPLLLQLVQTILIPMIVGASMRAYIPGEFLNSHVGKS
jgi:sodium/bile acid cotransporter 7